MQTNIKMQMGCGVQPRTWSSNVAPPLKSAGAVAVAMWVIILVKRMCCHGCPVVLGPHAHLSVVSRVCANQLLVLWEGFKSTADQVLGESNHMDL